MNLRASMSKPVVIVCLIVAVFVPALAHAGEIKGVVKDPLASAPLADTEVSVLDSGGKVVARTMTDGEGHFLITGLSGPSYTVVFVRLGYGKLTVTNVSPRTPRETGLSVTLHLMFSVVDTIVVTASRRPEPNLVAPASMSVVKRLPIYEIPQFTPVDYTRNVTGVDFAAKGLVQNSFTVRGLNGAMSGTMLTLTDYRYAAVPVLEFNLAYLMPTPSDDIKRIEILRGPNASMYGPNADQGVMHIITRSPFESQGTSVSLAGGERSVAQGAFRHAGVINDQFGYKISGEYFRGDDWEYFDPKEEGYRQDAIDNGADPDTLLIGKRDFEVENARGEARLDWKPTDKTLLTFTGGMAQAFNAIDLANSIGAIQVKDWRNSFLQTRFEHGKLNANLFYNQEDTEDTYALRTGLPLIDQSRIFVVQAQHGVRLAGRSNWTYGLDVRRSDPRTAGTINGRNEDDDTMSEFGAYLSTSTAMISKWNLAASLRVDYHDRINDAAVSPRVGVIYEPTVDQSLRLTWNRAFNSPKATDLFIDMSAGELLPGMDLRLLGVPKSGFNFSPMCGGLCMRSPFDPGGVAAAVPIDVTPYWDTLVSILSARFPAIQGVPAPNASQVASDLRYLNATTGSYDPPVPESQVRGVEQDKRRINNTIELGYKGTPIHRLYALADVYVNHVENYYGELYAVTPNVFYDKGDLEEYLVTVGGMTPQDAAAAASAASNIPMGTVAPDGVESADVLLWNRQGGSYTHWGVDVAGEFKLTQSVSLTATYSWVNKTVFYDAAVGPGAKVLSVPRNKGGVGVSYQGARNGVDASAQFRAVEKFPVISGAFKGDVDGYTVLDLTLGYRLPKAPELRLSINAQNVFDNRHREMVGAPDLGRLVVARVQWGF